PADVALVANLVIETLPPCRPARKNERRVKLVRAVVDPLAQCLAARLLERCLLQRAILENDDLPSEIIEELLIASPKPLPNNSIEALAIVVDDPPAIAKTLFPAFEQCLENISFVQFCVAHQRHHAALGPVKAPPVGAHVVLRQRGEKGLRDAK